MNGGVWKSCRSWTNARTIYERRKSIRLIRTFFGSGRLDEGIQHGKLSRRHDALLQAKIAASGTELYPRIESPSQKLGPGQLPKSTSCKDLVTEWQDWVTNGSSTRTDLWITQGRLTNLRALGNKLWFLDIIAEQAKIQGICNLGLCDDDSQASYQKVLRSLQRGDVIQLAGKLYQTRSGQPSIILSKPPQLLSPCLHSLPYSLEDQETIIGKRHLGFLTSPKASSLIRAKSSITQSIRQFLLNDDHIEVQTPILASDAGGAIARPFRTKATEFTDRELNLRIAPELWLKRMVVGGFDRVFEIGPSFRNEGIDLTHNPEFMTCEFYRSYTNLEGLMGMTEHMFNSAYKAMQRLSLPGLLPTDPDLFSPPYQRIDFILGLEQAIGTKLPNLSSLDALKELRQLVSDLPSQIQGTASMNLPQLLDKLSSVYLEPLCIRPTFITNHPACMSPLSKSYIHHSIPNQEVAARAELFVNGHEIANMYEEENSPVEQRRKFIEQLQFKSNRINKSTESYNSQDIDEAYLEALEWGMPPVGGWGCGIERLTMAMTGAERIRDVLSFGTLRNVIGKHQRS